MLLRGADRVRRPGAAATRPPLLLEAARELEAGRPALARATYLEALRRGTLRRPRWRAAAGIAEVSRGRAGAASAAAAGPRPPDLLLAGLGDPVHRRPRGGCADPEGRRCGRSVTRRPPAAGRRAGSRWRRCGRADLWDDETLDAARHAAAPARPRRRGADAPCRCIISMLSYIHAISGRARRGRVAARRAPSGHRGDRDRPLTPTWRSAVAALRGREAELSALIDPTAADAMRAARRVHAGSP